MHIQVTQKVERGTLAGLLLGPLGYRHRGIACSDAGLTVLSRRPRSLPYPEISAPLRLTRALGFHALAVSLRGGSVITVAGIGRGEAASFMAMANKAWRRHFVLQVEQEAEELHEIARIIERLGQPRRYPSACLVEPFLVRANRVAEGLPEDIPENVLPAERQASLDAVTGFRAAPQRIREAAIETFIKSELARCEEFFDTIESNPLTSEQRLAVVTDEDATLVLAGAGSGKTSVIVAKAAHLIHRDVRKPDEILLMAFGKDAAAEMASRIEERTGAIVNATTFHALGLEIIRAVEKGAPALAIHANDDVQFRALLKDILRNDVAARPDLGALLRKWFSEFYFPYKSEWGFKTKGEYFRYVEAHELRTLQGHLVRSFEEWEIANWLYLNGIAYEYEPVYEHDIPGNDRGAYTPDFRLTESGIYIEHFGVRKARRGDGTTRLSTAPFVDRASYLKGMEWKRSIHKEHCTTLIETFSYERVEGRLTEALEEKLKPYIVLDPLPPDDMLVRLLELGQIDAFTKTLGTFLRHFKSSEITLEDCRMRVGKSADKPRCLAFLQIFEAVFESYQRRLDGRIDFEDMIVRATGHLKSGRFQSPYRHLLVDEFQDISAGRARLLLALKEQHDDARIFAVGDDWQSIYRFTGSDIQLMRNFGQKFGGTYAGCDDVHEIVDLGRTFRSVDRIALPARDFVLRNPSQITKQVMPAGGAMTPAIRIMHYSHGKRDGSLVATLNEIRAGAASRTSVLLLGRYGFLKPDNLPRLNADCPGLSIQFKTVHGSKGLEADHVVILGADSGRMGFPSEIEDDPLLDLVLPEPEEFEHAEERRLFYVALTRARKSVTILASREEPSAFVDELLKDPKYGVVRLGKSGITEQRCGACGGRMLSQTSKKGRTFFACEHRYLCGERLWPCSACGEDLPVADRLRPGRLVCRCGAGLLVLTLSRPECPELFRIEAGIFPGLLRFPGDLPPQVQI